MKYCLSARQPDSVLKKADEIKIELRDYKAIPEYIEKFSDKTLILDFTDNIPNDFNWEVISVYMNEMNGNFYCALNNLDLIPECALRGIKFYYKYPVTSLFELEGLKQLGVSYILVGIPLIFDLKTVKSFGIPLRVIPNLAYEPYIVHNNGIIGGWIRPEDTEAYGEFIDVFEFFAPQSLTKEATIFKVYAENKAWPGNLNLLIDYFNFDFDNRLLYDKDNFAKRRMNCKQKCLSNKTCHYCETQLLFPQTTLKKYQEYKNNN